MQPAPLQSAPNEPTGNLDRRAYARHKLRSVAYVDFGPGNGGLVLNVSETGLALSLAMQLGGEELPQLNFRLPGQEYPIKARGRVVWTGKSRKELGLRFEQLRNRDLRRIREWIATQPQLLVAADTSSAFRAPLEADQANPSDQADAELSPASVKHTVVETSRAVWSTEPASIPTPSPITYDPALLNANAAGAGTARNPLSSRGLVWAVVLLAFVAGLFVEQQLQRAKKTKASAAAANQQQNPAHDTAAASPSILSPAAIASRPDSTPDQLPPTTAANEPSSNPQASAIGNASEDVPGTRATKTNESVDASPAQLSRDVVGSNSLRSGQHQKRAPVEEPLERSRTNKSGAGSATNSRNPTPLQSALPPVTDSAKPTQGNVPVKTHGDAAATAATEKPTADQSRGPEAAPAQSDNSNPSSMSAASPAPVNAPPPSDSVTVQAPPFPSIRIPPELQSSFAPGGQKLQMGQLVSRVQPIYPQRAIAQGIQGSVKAHLTIGADGTVENVQADGSPLLAEAATSALQQWRFRPTVVNGTSIGADMDVVLVFRLSSSSVTR